MTKIPLALVLSLSIGTLALAAGNPRAKPQKKPKEVPVVKVVTSPASPSPSPSPAQVPLASVAPAVIPVRAGNPVPARAARTANRAAADAKDAGQIISVEDSEPRPILEVDPSSSGPDLPDADE